LASKISGLSLLGAHISNAFSLRFCCCTISSRHWTVGTPQATHSDYESVATPKAAHQVSEKAVQIDAKIVQVGNLQPSSSIGIARLTLALATATRSLLFLEHRHAMSASPLDKTSLPPLIRIILTEEGSFEEFPPLYVRAFAFAATSHPSKHGILVCCFGRLVSSFSDQPEYKKQKSWTAQGSREGSEHLYTTIYIIRFRRSISRSHSGPRK
jgi:hypothetical protein